MRPLGKRLRPRFQCAKLDLACEDKPFKILTFLLSSTATNLNPKRFELGSPSMVKGVGLRLLSCRGSWVQIPPPAPFNFSLIPMEFLLCSFCFGWRLSKKYLSLRRL